MTVRAIPWSCSPDITPSIARAVSQVFSGRKKARSVSAIREIPLSTIPAIRARLKETTHLGAEFIGADSPQADAEIVAMVVDCLKSAGLEELQISMGQLDYFKSILKDVIIDEESEGRLKDFIANRNIFGVESILDQLEIQGKVRDVTDGSAGAVWIGRHSGESHGLCDE